MSHFAHESCAMRLFISYSRDDKAWVYELWRALRDRAFHDAWIDRRIVPAQDWWDTILTHIEQAECFIYVLTPKAVESIYCLAEMRYALALNKPVVPLVLKPCDYPLDLSERRIQYATVEDGMTVGDVLFTVERALGEIRVGLVQGRYAPPDPPPPRPDEPKPEQEGGQVREVFMLAEEAASENNTSLAEKLFQQVVDADPEGYGQAATERLKDIRYERERNADYLTVAQMATNPASRKGATALWRVFVAKYGVDYDPDGIEALLTTHPVQASSTEPAVSPVRIQSRVTELLPPPFEWIEIPAGRVTLEDGRGDFDVPAFQIAKYPITNAQFQVFADAEDGYCHPRWWDYSPEAAQWRRENDRPAPGGWSGPKQPRETVCWYEAVAFCRWLSDRTGEMITLPTEQQWQRAAQGDDGREYPWGNDFDPMRCNTGENRISRTTDVDRFPTGESPYGVMDMAGNVWEWCLNAYDNPTKTLLTGSEARVVRGGSWGDALVRARAAYRRRYNPLSRDYFYGFRVVCVPHL